jgi:hypothetical protein
MLKLALQRSAAAAASAAAAVAGCEGPCQGWINRRPVVIL